jgi:hypothetical protein
MELSARVYYISDIHRSQVATGKCRGVSERGCCYGEKGMALGRSAE